ncbi:hypothetical protein TNCV_2628931 [Trichonephila clavipes]|uniref:Uncharacterized protein n=1 Tax=Trichonephila clavipes TaxID=2585209 RepID=A0A8X6SB29_TRICX|nr:hypothetical protein TNCV_2628931 [Trichonephila clavipes]
MMDLMSCLRTVRPASRNANELLSPRAAEPKDPGKIGVYLAAASLSLLRRCAKPPPDILWHRPHEYVS